MRAEHDRADTKTLRSEVLWGSLPSNKINCRMKKASNHFLQGSWATLTFCPADKEKDYEHKVGEIAGMG